MRPMKKLTKTLLICLLSAYALPSFAQATDDEIYVYQLTERKSKISIAKGENITNRKGYDNQPHFYKKGALLYTSQLGGQTDIMLYDLKKGTTSNLTASEVSEYSATMVPGLDAFSVIRQDLEGNQLLYMYDINQNKAPELLLDGIFPVGYHAWSGNDVAMFILGQPVKMVLTNYKERNDRTITTNIGRTLKTIPNSDKIAFERYEEDKSVVIYALTPSTDKFEKIIQKPANSSDWAITKNGTYITSVGSKLLKYNAQYDTDWVELIDLGETAARGMTRMAVSTDNKRIAIVTSR